MYHRKALMESAVHLAVRSGDMGNGACSCWDFLPGRNEQGKASSLCKGEFVLHPGVSLEEHSLPEDLIVDVSEKCVIHIGKVFF